jgi:hypothetical protein
MTDNIHYSNFNIPENMFYALKSFYRFNKLMEMNAPDILIKTESDILESKLSKLSEDEIDALDLLYPEFAREQEINETIEDVELDKELERSLVSLN